MVRGEGGCEATGKFGRCGLTRASTGHPYCDKHAIAYGVRQPMVSTAFARMVIRELQAAGWSQRLIAKEAGVAENTVWQATRRDVMRTQSARKIIALRGREPESRRVAVWPYKRMLRSLQAAGHTGRQLAEGTGIPASTISYIVNAKGDLIARGQAAAIRAYWREHCTDPVGAPTATAKRHQWPVPMWWDNIDDPREKPGVTHCVNCHAPEVGDISPLCKRCRNSRNGHAYRQRQKRKAKAA